VNKKSRSYGFFMVALVVSTLSMGGVARAEDELGHGWEAVAGSSQVHGWEGAAGSAPIVEVGHGYEATAEPVLVAEAGHGWEAGVTEPTLVTSTGHGWESVSGEPSTIVAAAEIGRHTTSSRDTELSGAASEDGDRAPGLVVDPLQMTASLTLGFLVGVGCALTIRHMRLARR
jgi:hypothetical protein